MSKFADIRKELHRIPEPGFQEFKTQALLLDYLSSLPQERLEIRTWRTGILARIKGTAGKRRIAYRTDIDGLPIEEETSYEFRSLHPGYMHACGHDMHMSIALGIVTHFVLHPIEDDVIVIFQPAEEGRRRRADDAKRGISGLEAGPHPGAAHRAGIQGRTAGDEAGHPLRQHVRAVHRSEGEGRARRLPASGE